MNDRIRDFKFSEKSTEVLNKEQEWHCNYDVKIVLLPRYRFRFKQQ